MFENVFIIGMMNIVDWSIVLVDIVMWCRFAFMVLYLSSELTMSMFIKWFMSKDLL